MNRLAVLGERLVDSGYREPHLVEASDGSEALAVVPLVGPVGQWYDEWCALRISTLSIGYRPLAVGDLPLTEHDLRFFFPDGSTAASILEAADSIDPDSFFRAYVPWAPDPTTTPLEDFLREELYGPPTVVDGVIEEAKSELGPVALLREVERWLVNHWITEGPREILPNDAWIIEGEDIAGFVFIPSVHPMDGLAYIAILDSGDPSTCLAWARRWHQDHGAELVAAAGCSYLFEMPRPILDSGEAWRFGVELNAAWSCSFGGGPQGVTPAATGGLLSRVTRFDGTNWP